MAGAVCTQKRKEGRGLSGERGSLKFRYKAKSFLVKPLSSSSFFQGLAVSFHFSIILWCVLARVFLPFALSFMEME